MNKTLGVLLTASVIVILGVIVSSLFYSGIDLFDTESSDINQSGCDYQQARVAEDDVKRGQLTDTCKDEEFDQDMKVVNAVKTLNGNS